VRLAVSCAVLFAAANSAIYAWQDPRGGAFRPSLRALPATCLVVLVCALNETVWMILLPLFLAMTACILYFVYYFRVPLSTNLIALVLETTPDEANGLAGWHLAAWLLAAIAIAVPLVVLRRRRRWRDRSAAMTAVAVAGALTVVLPPSRYLSLPQPIGIFQQFSIYVREYRERHRAAGRLVDASGGMTARGDTDLSIVFILGESARWDHFQINGYARPTSPNLIRDSVTSFRPVTACAAITRNSVPCTLRGVAPPPAPLVERTSIVSVFAKAGFRTAWISNQGLGGMQSTPLAPLAAEAAVRIFTPKGAIGFESELYDDNLLPALDRVLGAGNRNFIVLHTIGSHWHYRLHHPAAFTPYQPECVQDTPSRCDHAALINAYDNTIVYTDHIIDAVIQRLRNRNALVVFISDHGEGLGDPYFMHGHGKGLWDGTPEEMRVPLFVWASPSWKAKNASRARSIEVASQATTTYETIFHSLIDCAGIRVRALDRDKSFCSTSQY
jgi:glucan phosphoethanolaminetransferase (alkaline phosphatase superfamily)